MDALGSTERPFKITITWERSHAHGDPRNFFTAKVRLQEFTDPKYTVEAKSRSIDHAVAYALQDLAAAMLRRDLTLAKCCA